MAKTLRLQVTQKEISSSGASSNETSYIVTGSFDNYLEGQFTLPSVNSFTTVDLGNLSSVSIYRLKSDTAITYRVNGSTTDQTLNKECYVFGGLTQLQVKNTSGSDVVFEYQFYGG